MILFRLHATGIAMIALREQTRVRHGAHLDEDQQSGHSGHHLWQVHDDTSVSVSVAVAVKVVVSNSTKPDTVTDAHAVERWYL